MRLTRISLSDFKRHAALEIEPAAGLTIIRGPNEAGKSTILEALQLALFRKADSNREDVRLAQRWGSSAAPQVTLELEADGREVTLVKRFAGARGEAELVTDGETIRDFGLIQERIADLTGVPSEGFLRATASVAHAELADVAGADGPAISDRLQRAVSGVDRGTARAKRKLETAIHRYRTEGSKNPGLLKALRDEILALEAELVTGEQSLSRLEADRAQLAEAQARRASLDVQLSRQRADLVVARRAEALITQRDTAQARYDRLKRAAELVEEAEGLAREMPIDIPLATLRTTVNRATTLSFEVSEVEAEIGAGESADAEAGEAEPPRPVPWLVGALGLLGAAASSWLLLGGLAGSVLAVVLALAALVTLGQASRIAVRRRQHGLAMRLASDAAVRLQEHDLELQERFRRRRRELEALLGSIGMADVAAAQVLLASVEQHTDRMAHIEGELRGMGVEERTLRRLEEARDEAADATEQARHALAGMGEPAEDPAGRRQTLERLAEQTQSARDRARSEEDQAQGRVDANLVDAEIVAGLAERCAAARARETELVRRLRIYEATRQAIEAAEQATLKTAARYLEEHMGPAVARITAGRYDEVEVDERSLAFRARAPETGQLVDVGQLSRGTADQLFLTARLGLVRLVTMDRRPPIILDDPFVTFDAERAERAIELLKEAAAGQGFQVLLLTCSDRFDALADSVVVLEAPAAIPAASRPDPRPDPRPVSRPTAVEEPEAQPVAVGLWAHESPVEADPETGIVDPFRLGHTSEPR
jgi:DNA repair exonuclease SbcCD ATPase subunit